MRPHFGHVLVGGRMLTVHALTADYHAAGGAYARFNQRVAALITRNVGTMTCFWAFSAVAGLSLPATLVLVGWIPRTVSWLPGFLLSLGWIYLIQWVTQSYVQLVLLPALMVGQNLQNAAADARSALQFEHTEQIRADQEVILDRLDEHTAGGLAAVIAAIADLPAAIAAARPEDAT